MMVRASACLQALQQRAGPYQRRGGPLLASLAMIAFAVCGAIASVPHPDRANDLDDLPVMSGERCMEQVVQRP